MSPKSTLLLFAFAVAACATGTSRPTKEIESPLPRGTETAYAEAGMVTLPEEAPETKPGLHNVYRLSDDIVSGAEPEGEEAFQELHDMGIKTILSVDGKAPDAAAAARHGIRYVHIPIRYKGVTRDEMLEISKTFYELEGPFYVHCFHGKHRGPTAAAIGRVVLDGVSRERALAEMRQWSGTSAKYEGLYAAIAFDEMPTPAEAGSCPFDFPAQHRFTGFRSGMIDISRSWDTIEALSKRDWKAMAEHPDANARNEAERMAGTFEQLKSLPAVAEHGEDFRAWLGEAATQSEELAALLAKYQGGDATAGEQAMVLATKLQQSCSSCHKAYRNKDD